MTRPLALTALDGTYNFRDVGGLPLLGGGTTAPGILYRSDALGGLTPEGLEQLAGSDVGVIVDFRTPMERQMAPDRLPTSRTFATVEAPLLEGAFTAGAQQAMQEATQVEAHAGADAPATATARADTAQAIAQALAQLPSLGDLYVSMLEHGGASFARVASLVAASTDDSPSAVLVHCTAGKDRTGVSTALVLEAAGVERAAVVADYARSQQNLAGPWAEGMYAMVEKMGVPLGDEVRELIAGTPPTAIEHALAWVDAQYGSAAQYLLAGGLTDDELTALRGRLAA